MRPANPQPPSRSGVHEGLAYNVFLPAGDVVRSSELARYEGRNLRIPGVVILHGADSSRLSHLDFARRCAARGLAAVAFDQRGHGESAGALDGRAIDDVAVMASLLPPGPLVLRGSSMGGYLALVAGAALNAAAVVAICPATGAGLARGLDDGHFAFAADEPSLRRLLAAHDTAAAAVTLGERLLLLHAEGDEVVPVMVSRELHGAAPESRLVVVPGGDHRSVQQDADLQELSLRFALQRVRPPERRERARGA